MGECDWLLNDLINANLVSLLPHGFINVGCGVEYKVRQQQSDDLTFVCFVPVSFELINLNLLLCVELLDSHSCLPSVHNWHVYIANKELYRLNVCNRPELTRVYLVQHLLKTLHQLASVDEHLKLDVLPL